jgi:alanyl-tRNA synthetase
VSPAELVSEVDRLLLGQRDQRRVVRSLQSRLVVFDAASLVATGEAVGATTIVVAHCVGHDAGLLKAVAVEVVRRSGHIAVLTSDMRPVDVVVARANDVDLDAAAVVRALQDHWDGRGGGRPHVAQGRLNADPDEVTELARRLLAQALA